MPSIAFKRNYSSTSKTPRRAYEKERLDQELKLCGEYGLRCKREIWRVQLALAKIRKAARELLTLDAKDPKRLFEGPALLRKMVRYGLLSEVSCRARQASDARAGWGDHTVVPSPGTG